MRKRCLLSVLSPLRAPEENNLLKERSEAIGDLIAVRLLTRAESRKVSGFFSFCFPMLTLFVQILWKCQMFFFSFPLPALLVLSASLCLSHSNCSPLTDSVPVLL